MSRDDGVVSDGKRYAAMVVFLCSLLFVAILFISAIWPEAS